MPKPSLSTVRLPRVRYLSIGKKVAAGEAQPELCIRVHVSRKGGVRKGAVPERLRAVGASGKPLKRTWVRTDVVEAPEEIEALSLRGCDGIRRLMNGSAGRACRTRSGADVVLTNAHVVAGTDARRIGASVRQTWPAPAPSIGTVYRTVRSRTAEDVRPA